MVILFSDFQCLVDIRRFQILIMGCRDLKIKIHFCEDQTFLDKKDLFLTQMIVYSRRSSLSVITVSAVKLTVLLNVTDDWFVLIDHMVNGFVFERPCLKCSAVQVVKCFLKKCIFLTDHQQSSF